MSQVFQKIRKHPDLFVFFLFILSLPLQTRKVIEIFIDYSYPIFPEWGASFIYLSDILLAACLIVFAIIYLTRRQLSVSKATALSNPRAVDQKSPSVDKSSDGVFRITFIIATAFFLYSFISALFISDFHQIGFFYSIKIGEGILLLAYVAYYAKKSPYLITIVTSLGLLIGGVSQSIIDIIQYFTQKSVGLFVLGESIVSHETLNIGKIDIAGDKIIRALGTFPHSNVLGGFLVISILFSILLLFHVKHFTHQRLQTCLILISIAIQLFGLTLSFSRSAWLALIVSLMVCLIYLFIDKLHKKTKFSVSGILIVCAFILYLSAIGFVFRNEISTRLFHDDIDVSRETLTIDTTNPRITSQQIGKKIIKKNTVLGMGLGSFIPSMQIHSDHALESYEFQPIHNVYLMVLSEEGVLGFILLATILALALFQALQLFHVKQYSLIPIILISLLILMYFDHYLWDIQQGKLLFWLIFAICFIKPHHTEKQI